MSPESNPKKTKVCPTCGTRLSENATRCLVCGTELTAKAAAPKAEKAMQASQMPQVTLSLPVALGLLALFLVVGALVVFGILRGTGRVVEPTPDATETVTPTITASPTETLIPTLAPTETPLPPFDYTVASGDTCSSIAFTFGVSVQSIIVMNNLPVACNTLYIGQVVKVPYPTPTVTPPPTATFESAQATIAACEKVIYTVQENDTLSAIAANYGVPQAAIKDYNGLASDNVYLGQPLSIPLCMRATPEGQPTATPTTPPPYPAPNLLLPADGGSFSLANDVISLQWASVGVLRENERYQITIEDVTDGQGRRIVDYVTDTKYIVPNTFRPKDSLPHVIRWWVTPVRQTGSDDQGQPIWTPAGASSTQRVFSWLGVAPAP